MRIHGVIKMKSAKAMICLVTDGSICLYLLGRSLGESIDIIIDCLTTPLELGAEIFFIAGVDRRAYSPSEDNSNFRGIAKLSSKPSNESIN